MHFLKCIIHVLLGNCLQINSQGKLAPPLTDVVNGSSAEFPIELFRPKATQVLDRKGPEVQHIVPREGIPLLQQHHLGSQEAQLYGRPEATWSRTDDQAL